MPSEPPSWRERLKSPVPSAIWRGASDATVTPVSGTNTRPSPTPRRIIGNTVSCIPISVVNCDCRYIDHRKRSTPATISGRASILSESRPAIGIVNADASAPGRITRPVSSAE